VLWYKLKFHEWLWIDIDLLLWQPSKTRRPHYPDPCACYLKDKNYILTISVSEEGWIYFRSTLFVKDHEEPLFHNPIFVQDAKFDTHFPNKTELEHNIFFIKKKTDSAAEKSHCECHSFTNIMNKKIWPIKREKILIKICSIRLYRTCYDLLVRSTESNLITSAATCMLAFRASNVIIYRVKTNVHLLIKYVSKFVWV